MTLKMILTKREELKKIYFLKTNWEKSRVELRDYLLRITKLITVFSLLNFLF